MEEVRDLDDLPHDTLHPDTPEVADRAADLEAAEDSRSMPNSLPI